jgi:hypothetical protein
VADIALHSRQVVPERTKGRQHPILHFEHADNFALAYYAGGDAQPKGLPFAEAPEIEPGPGAWRGISQPGQNIQGPQTNIVGNVDGPVLSGEFRGPVTVGGGEAVDMRGARDVIYKPSGPVDMGDRTSVHGDGNIIGDFGRATVIKPSADSVTLEGFLRLLAGVRKGLPSAGLEMELAQVIESDLQSVESQAQRSKPNRMLLLIKLKSVVDLLSASEGGGRDSDRVLLQAELALAWGQQLFGL